MEGLLPPWLLAQQVFVAVGRRQSRVPVIGSGLEGLKMTDHRRALAGLLLGAATLLGSANAQDGFRVIVNASNPVSSLRQAEVSRLFLKKTIARRTACLSLRSTSSVRRTSATRSAARYTARTRMPSSPSGRRSCSRAATRPPWIKASDAAVLEFVRGNAAAIGYVSGGAELDGVKVARGSVVRCVLTCPV